VGTLLVRGGGNGVMTTE